MFMTQVQSSSTQAVLLLALCQLAPAGHAQSNDLAGAPARLAVSPQVVSQKFAMVDKVLDQSPVAARVLNSQSEQARRHFASARELVSKARALSADGLLRGADALLNEAIWEISRAQQLAPDAASQQAGEKARFAQLEDSVAALQRTASITLSPAGGRQDEPAQRLAARAAALVEQSVALARADRYIEANKQLDQALVLLLKDVSARLAGHTIVYDRRFADRREEFAFEIERHRSFERLVPLAMLEFRPGPEAQILINRYVAQARELRDRGQAQVDRDPISALKHVLDGTDALRRALQAAGLVVPQTMDSQ